MYIALAMLDVCDAVYMLANWEDSRDAKIEHAHAKKGGKKIMYEEDVPSDYTNIKAVKKENEK